MPPSNTTAVVMKPQEKFRSLLERMKGELAKALPRHLTPDRMIRLALTVYGRDSKLQQCSPDSALVAVVQAAQLGLELDPILGHAYLIPRKGVATLLVGYRGYLELARRSGQVSQFYAHVVHERDSFSFSYGTNLHLEHVPADGDAGPPVKVYAFLRLKDGSFDLEVIPWSKVLMMQAEHGKNGGPWKTHLEEMARKSAIRALAKRCPLSAEFQRAADFEAGLDAAGPAIGELLPSSQADRLAARLAHDPTVLVAPSAESYEPLPDDAPDDAPDDDRAEAEAIRAEANGG